jgi:hypothetical protein
MSSANIDSLSPAERAQFAVMVERTRQLRLHAGMPDGIPIQQALVLCIISAEELERARWGDTGSPGPTESPEVPHGLS